MKVEMDFADFISVEEAIRTHEAMAKREASYERYLQPDPRDERIRDGWFHHGWLPFADFGGGTLTLFSDMSPSGSGKTGQIIGFVHDPDEMVYVAPGFAELLEASLDALQKDAEEYFFDV